MERNGSPTEPWSTSGSLPQDTPIATCDRGNQYSSYTVVNQHRVIGSESRPAESSPPRLSDRCPSAIGRAHQAAPGDLPGHCVTRGVLEQQVLGRHVLLSVVRPVVAVFAPGTEPRSVSRHPPRHFLADFKESTHSAAPQMATWSRYASGARQARWRARTQPRRVAVARAAPR